MNAIAFRYSIYLAVLAESTSKLIVGWYFEYLGATVATDDNTECILLTQGQMQQFKCLTDDTTLKF
jgi:hypothetical protein